MYEAVWHAWHKDAVRRGDVVVPVATLLDRELIAWAEREGLTHADVVRINF